MNRSRSRAVLRFLELKSIRENPPHSLMKRLIPHKEGERFPLSALLTGSESLWIQSAEYMVSKYADSRKEELRWLLLYFLELTSQGHIRISSDDIRDDFPLWAGNCYSGADNLYENLNLLVAENPRLFSAFQEENRPILFAEDLSCFYLLKKKRFEEHFLALLKNLSGTEGIVPVSVVFESGIHKAYERLCHNPVIPVSEDTLKAALMVVAPAFP